jgi:hypothetical protein
MRYRHDYAYVLGALCETNRNRVAFRCDFGLWSLEDIGNNRPMRWARHLMGAGRLLLVGLILGWLYDVAGPRLYPAGTDYGFGYGMVHGAFMPMALPALLVGRDVKIFSPGEEGRGYKLGYIAGINLCGLVFFGSAFWRPRRRAEGLPPN